MRELPPLLVCLLLASPSAARAADWPQLDFDASHSGNNPLESTLSAANVATLHVLYHVALPGVADGAPAFLAAVATAEGAKDLLFVTTKDGQIVALDAATGDVLWSHQPATGPRYTTSSPALDPGRGFVYSYALDGRVHKYQVDDGTEVTSGGWPQLATLKPDVEKGSSALTVATTGAGASYLYIANGGYPGDAGDYQGHVTTVDLATGAQTVFNAACSDTSVHFVELGVPDCPHVQTAVWARAGVVYDASLGKLFFATGNGDFDGDSGGKDWGDSVLAIAADGTGSGGGPLDSYTPTNFQHLDDADLDLGSTAPALLPTGGGAPHLAVQSGKDSRLRLLDLDDLSGAGGPGHVGGELQNLAVPQGGPVLSAPIGWANPGDGSAWLFVADGNGIAGLRLDLSGSPALQPQWTDGTGGSSPILANGVLYYATSSGVRALDPSTGNELWHDNSPVSLHWESPIVVHGRLYFTDEARNLWVYTSSLFFQNGFESGNTASWSAVEAGE